MMKFSTDGDTVAVETERADRELADAAGRLLRGAVDLAELVGVRECEWCEERARLRPYQLTVDGVFKVLDICPECQAEFVEKAVESEQGGGDDGEDDNADRDPPDRHDFVENTRTAADPFAEDATTKEILDDLDMEDRDD